MKRKNTICCVVLCIVLSNCTTMKGLKETKDEFKKGNILTGAWTGLMSVTVLPIVDVFTLGGSMDAEQSKEVWTGVAQQYSNQQASQKAQKAAQLQVQQAALARSVEQQSSYGTIGSSNSSSSGSYGTINSSNNYGNSSSTISSGQNSANALKTKKVTNSLNQCITVDHKPQSGMSFFNNKCGQKINVQWIDQKYCRTGCSADVSPNARQGVTVIQGAFNFTACPYGYVAYLPNAPQPSGYEWRGQSAYECRDW